MRKTGYKFFTKESYNSKRDAVLALKGYMPGSQICNLLEISPSSFEAMKKYNWEEYLVFREEKNATAKINKAKREKEMANFVQAVDYAPKSTWTKTPPDVKAPDQTEIVAQRLTAIEETLEDIKDIVNKRKFF